VTPWSMGGFWGGNISPDSTTSPFYYTVAGVPIWMVHLFTCLPRYLPV